MTPPTVPEAGPPDDEFATALWEDALADPATRAAIDAGLDDVRNGRIKEYNGETEWPRDVSPSGAVAEPDRRSDDG